MSESYIEITGHGYVASDEVVIYNLEGGTDANEEEVILEGVKYFVLAAGLTADAFQISLTDGGAAITWENPITEGEVQPWPTYSVVADGVLDPPTTPAAPSTPVVTYDNDPDYNMLRVTATVDAATATTRITEVQVTREFLLGSPVWDSAIVYALPPGTTSVTIDGAYGENTYAARARRQDVYGNYSDWTDAGDVTTAAGPDSIGLSNQTASVVVDADGLHVADGAMFIEDEFGESVLEASGFKGTWASFMATGLYNGAFGAGVPPIGTVDNGRTADLPYWTVTNTGVGTLQRDTDAAYPSGHFLGWVPGHVDDTLLLRSDLVDCLAGFEYSLSIVWGFLTTVNTRTVDVTGSIRYFDKDGDLIGSVSYGTITSPNDVTYDTRGAPELDFLTKSILPNGAAFMQAQVQFAPSGTNYTGTQVWLGAVTLRPAVQAAAVSDVLYSTLQPNGQPLIVAEIGTSILAADASVTTQTLDAQYIIGPVHDTYTVTVSGGGTATFSNRGWYMQIGEIVFLHIDITVTGTGSGGTAVTFNLPVTAITGTNQAVSGYVTGLTGESGPCAASVGSGGSSISNVVLLDGTTLIGSDLDSTNGRIRLNGWYYAA